MSKRSIFIGHSLVGKDMPQMFNELMKMSGQSETGDYQVINGAPLWYNWANSGSAEGVDARAVLPSGDYGFVVVTEAIPLAEHLEWSNTYQAALDFYMLATQYNPDTLFLIYETWPPLGDDDVAWRAQLDNDLDAWQGIVSYINANRGADQPEAGLLPGGQAMAALYDAIQVGEIAGLNSIHDIFSDEIHLNNLGNYYIALVHFSLATQTSPIGLDHDLRNEWGQPYDGLTAEIALALQTLAWQTVTEMYPELAIEGDAEAGGSNGSFLEETNDNDIMTGAGNDTVIVNGGDNIVWAGSGNDRVVIQGNGDNRVGGGIGNDTIIVDGDGANTLYGGADNDEIWLNGNGDNIAWGGLGADLIVVNGDGDNQIGAGAGSDTVEVNGHGDNTVFGGIGQGENIITINGNGSNIVYGGNSAGTAGNTITIDGNGANEVWNGTGNDTVVLTSAATGANTLMGGAGDDEFVFQAGASGTVKFSAGDGHDTISGFDLAADQFIDVSGLFGSVAAVQGALSSGGAGISVLTVAPGQSVTIDVALNDLLTTPVADWLIV